MTDYGTITMDGCSYTGWNAIGCKAIRADDTCPNTVDDFSLDMVAGRGIALAAGTFTITDSAITFTDTPNGGMIYTTADVEQWCWDGIADYSQHVHTSEIQTINCAAGDGKYDLPFRMIDVISVEYHDGQDPPQFLERRRLLRHPVPQQ